MNISTAISSFLKHLRYGKYINPLRDWLVMLIFSAIAIAGIIVWNVWAFDTVANGGIIGSSTTKTTPVFSRSSLDTIYEIFANRTIEKEKYKNGIYNFADPSQ